MQAPLDTHAALFAWIEPDRLSPKAREFIKDPENQLLFSQVSALEITLKHKLGKLELPEPPETYLRSRIEQFAFTYLRLDDEDIYGILTLPDSHKDSFDWLLLSNARRRKIPLISKDSAFKSYPVELLW
jgi:Uncharacterized protein conserved in bacteria